MKKILFLPSNKNHVYLFLPILSKLKSDYETLFITQGSYKSEGAEKTLGQFNIKFKKFEDYKEQNPDFILKSEKINLVIIGNDIDVIPQWFVNCSNSLQIPSILIQDGMLFNFKTQQKYFSKISTMLTNSKKLIKLSLKLKIQKKYKKITYGESTCDQIHVWGKNAETYLRKKNIDPKKITITGNPKFKISVTLEPKPNKIKQVLYCPTSLIETGILDKSKVTALVQTLCEVISEIKGVNLIIKPHPIEKKLFYEKIIRLFNKKVKLTTQNVDELLKTSDCLITNLSTVSIDALVCSKPVLLYFPNLQNVVETDSFPQILLDKQVALYAYDKESLRNQLTKILQGNFTIKESNRKEILEELYGSIDSNAASRSAEHIKNILK